MNTLRPKYSVPTITELTFLLAVTSLLIPGCLANRFLQQKENFQPIIRVKLYDGKGPITIKSETNTKIIQANGNLLTQEHLEETISTHGTEITFGNLTINIGNHLDIIPEKNKPIQLANVPYRGWLRVLNIKGNIVIVNYVPVEDYLKGVLSAELPRWFSEEAYKAQAIVSRTYVLYEKYSAPNGKLWDVVSTERSQVYKGIEAETQKSKNAVEETRGIVLTTQIDGHWRIFPTYFSSTCGGWTQPAWNIANIKHSIKPLSGNIKCNWCKNSPYYRWKPREVPFNYIKDRLNERYPSRDPIEVIHKIEVTEWTKHNRIKKVEISYNNNCKIKMTGELFRCIVGTRYMPSTFCKLKSLQDSILIYDGRGLGHGAGLCQWGAEGLARKGLTAIEILQYYYPHSKPVKAY